MRPVQWPRAGPESPPAGRDAGWTPGRPERPPRWLPSLPGAPALVRKRPGLAVDLPKTGPEAENPERGRQDREDAEKAGAQGPEARPPPGRPPGNPSARQ